MTRILIVEDEDKLRNTLVRGLSEQGFSVVAASDGEEGLEFSRSEQFDCLVVDMMLPIRDGLEMVSQLRSEGNTTPILMLTARRAIEDRVVGLDSGADDYLCKPFVWAELLARIRARVRQLQAPESHLISCGPVTLDCANRLLVHGESNVELTIRQCELLEYLIRRCDQDVTREELAREVWREPLCGLTNVIDVYISYLRRKLAKLDDPLSIQTIRGVGYRLEQ